MFAFLQLSYFPLPLASVHSSRACRGRHKVIPLCQGWPRKYKEAEGEKNHINNWERDFSTSIKLSIHNTSSHTRKCDNSSVMNIVSVSSPDGRNTALILNGWVSAILSQLFKTIRNWRKSNKILSVCQGNAHLTYFLPIGLVWTSKDIKAHCRLR